MRCARASSRTAIRCSSTTRPSTRSPPSCTELDLGPLADADQTLSIAADAVVRPTGLLGSLTTSLASVTSNLLKTVVNVILPGGGDTSGPAVPPSVLRETLGVGDSRWTGRGVGVAVIDSGLEMSAEFQGRVTAFYDMTGGRTVATSPFDDYGHGTHVAGTIGGSGALSRSNDYRGLAPNVRLIVLKALDKTGAGYTSDVIRAIDFAVENRARFGISIINLSLGHPIAQPAGADPLVQAVERASRAGVIVVVAAGNQGVNPTTGQPGYAGITSPGNAPSAITVGAARTDSTVIRSDDRIPDYSSAGPTWYDAMVKPDVVAPGHNIVAVAAKQKRDLQDVPAAAGGRSGLHPSERHEHGHGGHQRIDRAAARGQPHGLSRQPAAHRQCGESHPAVHGGWDSQRPRARVRPAAQGRRGAEHQGRDRLRRVGGHVGAGRRAVADGVAVPVDVQSAARRSRGIKA